MLLPHDDDIVKPRALKTFIDGLAELGVNKRLIQNKRIVVVVEVVENNRIVVVEVVENNRILLVVVVEEVVEEVVVVVEVVVVEVDGKQ